jgi:hypothetical protein
MASYFHFFIGEAGKLQRREFERRAKELEEIVYGDGHDNYSDHRKNIRDLC